MNEGRIKRDYFGFLPWEFTIEFDGGKVSPTPEFDEVAASVKKDTHEDGFLYPPIEYRVRVDPVTIKPLEKIPKTERPAHLYRIPPSHELCLYHSGTIEDTRRGAGSIVIHLLAYLFRIRLQFYDWWIDGRVPILEKARSHNITFDQNTIEDFLSHCYKMWKSWCEEKQKLIINILFMHSRTPSYEWDWERFTIEYMVLDGCYRLAKSLHLTHKKQRKQKKTRNSVEPIETLCQSFQIPYDDDLARKIVNHRNELFHRTLWDGSQPGTAESSFAFELPGHLRRLNQRFIPALFGYRTPYVQTKWWLSGLFPFDPPSER